MLYDNLRKGNLLWMAWGDVRSSGLKSQEGQIKREVIEFEDKADGKLRYIKDLLRKKRYTFEQVRGYTDRKGKKPRPIAIPHVRDKIVQRALLLLLRSQTPIKEVINNDSSFGGIEKRGVREAIARVDQAIRAGYRYYVKSDIKEFFPNINRISAVTMTSNILSDTSLNNIFDAATLVDLENAGQMWDKDLSQFPDGDIGVAQGFCLSPLMGNIYLREFDSTVASSGVVLVRYIDDFIVLAKDQRSAQKAFYKGLRVLAKLGLSAYRLDEPNTKADEGPTGKGFDFLGCTISDTCIAPQKSATKKLIRSVRDTLEHSKAKLVQRSFSKEDTHKKSLATTLHKIDRQIWAWGDHYAFCDGRVAFQHIDKEIDKLLKDYLGCYGVQIRAVDNHQRRRMLGVQWLGDRKYEPIRKH